MNEIEIFRAGNSLLKIKPSKDSNQSTGIPGINELRLTFQLDFYVNFKLNDYCTVFFETYKVKQLPVVTKESTYAYVYNMTMKAEGFDLEDVQYLNLGPTNLLTQGVFDLTGNADTFIDLLIQNANRTGSGWIKGQVIPTDYKTLTFNSESCYKALAHIANDFKTEFAIEGKTVHLTQRARDTGITLRHGRNRGLYTITRQNVDNSKIITRLYAFGSSKNLPVGYRDTRLRLPGVDYLELHVGEYGLIEGTYPDEDIYPQRDGKVTSINNAEIFKFYDATVDFDLNTQYISGVNAKVNFKTGQLAGYSFDVSAYNHGLKEFTILKNKDEKVLDMPSVDFRPAIGDLYTLTDINMPQSYVDKAELRLKNKAIEVLEAHAQPQLQYTIVPDPVFFRRRKLSVAVGDEIWLHDQQLEITRQIRIITVTRNLVDEFAYTVELGDILNPGPITIVTNETTVQGRALGMIGRQIEVLRENNLGDLPTITDTTGYSQVWINNTTGKLVKKI